MTEKPSNKVLYREAMWEEEKGDKKVMTIVAFNKLTGRGGAEVDEEEAVSLLEERVKDKDSEAMWMLGLCYEYGIGIEQDIKCAEYLYYQSHECHNEIGRFLWLTVGFRRGSNVMKLRISL